MIDKLKILKYVCWVFFYIVGFFFFFSFVSLQNFDLFFNLVDTNTTTIIIEEVVNSDDIFLEDELEDEEIFFINDLDNNIVLDDNVDNENVGYFSKFYTFLDDYKYYILFGTVVAVFIGIGIYNKTSSDSLDNLSSISSDTSSIDNSFFSYDWSSALGGLSSYSDEYSSIYLAREWATSSIESSLSFSDDEEKFARIFMFRDDIMHVNSLIRDLPSNHSFRRWMRWNGRWVYEYGNLTTFFAIDKGSTLHISNIVNALYEYYDTWPIEIACMHMESEGYHPIIIQNFLCYKNPDIPVVIYDLDPKDVALPYRSYVLNFYEMESYRIEAARVIYGPGNLSEWLLDKELHRFVKYPY